MMEIQFAKIKPNQMLNYSLNHKYLLALILWRIQTKGCEEEDSNILEYFLHSYSLTILFRN